MKRKAITARTLASKPTDAKPAGSGAAGRKVGTSSSPTQQEMDAATVRNRELQLNPNNDRYWKARGHDGRPENWEASSRDFGAQRS